MKRTFNNTFEVAVVCGTWLSSIITIALLFSWRFIPGGPIFVIITHGLTVLLVIWAFATVCFSLSDQNVYETTGRFAPFTWVVVGFFLFAYWINEGYLWLIGDRIHPFKREIWKLRQAICKQRKDLRLLQGKAGYRHAEDSRNLQIEALNGLRKSPREHRKQEKEAQRQASLKAAQERADEGHQRARKTFELAQTVVKTGGPPQSKHIDSAF